MASIMKIFDDLKFSSSQRSDGDVYLKLIEAFKFAFAQRSKIGDPFNSPYQDKIEKVGFNILFTRDECSDYYILLQLILLFMQKKML